MTHRNGIDKSADIQRFDRSRMHTKKRTFAPKFISIFLSAILALTMMPAAALANPASVVADLLTTAQATAASSQSSATAIADDNQTAGTSAEGEGATDTSSPNATQCDDPHSTAADNNLDASSPETATNNPDDVAVLGASFTPYAADGNFALDALIHHR